MASLSPSPPPPPPPPLPPSNPTTSKSQPSIPFKTLHSTLIKLGRPFNPPTPHSWNSLIHLHPSHSLHIFSLMLSSGHSPNTHTFPSLLRACAHPSTSRALHAHLLKSGLPINNNPFIHSSLVATYAKTHLLLDAQKLFDFGSNPNPVSATALIVGYADSGQPDMARELFDSMPVRDAIAWNAMISAYARCGRSEDAFNLFDEMLSSDAQPTESTMASVLSACAQAGEIETGEWVRRWIEDRGFGANVRLLIGLVDMYAKCGDLEAAHVLFDGLRRPRGVVSWNVMIGGYARLERFEDSLALFRRMQIVGEAEPNEVTLLGVIPACANLGALDVGRWIHAYVERMNVDSNALIRTSLIDMYAKCGGIESAKQVFDSMTNKSLSSTWNAMISGLAMHGFADEAFKLFDEMVDAGVNPDEITFVGILSACAHSGLLEMGRKHFNSMIEDFKISPKLEHYGCMIDLLGRAGLFEEAEMLIKESKLEPDGVIWGSLLGDCRIHKKVELGEFVAEKLLELEPDNSGIHITLSNIYASVGRWDDVARIRTALNDKGMKKVPGCSAIEVESVVHEFLVGDRVHARCEEVYAMLGEIDEKLGQAGHVVDTSEVVFDVEEGLKEGMLSYHSEKLAIAFGLISTSPGTTIRIVKNLRICANCHSATKLISKIYKREIVARDRNRFHHFKEGVCSCNDYW